MNTLGFIGLGNMGAAILKGFTAASQNSGSSEIVKVFGYDVFDEKKPLLEQYGGEWLDSECELARKCKYLLLGVKPQSAGEVISKIAPSLNSESVIITICAGISAGFIRECAGKDVKVIQVMPNTPMMLGEGASAVSSDEKTSRTELDFACSVIGSCSPVVEIIPAERMNEVICINGSSPAFIYTFAKCFVDYATENGINGKTALNLFSQSLIGSAEMLIESGMTPDELISQVSSPNGTTVAGLAALQKRGFSESVKAACESCTLRAYELSKR
ncbi:MAG: pyrroline-5-carboxylate reductase [Oscillospiraceae bacterium]|nr:pyrroline-5-carboxylate reductase [Oscillospiraceae bacterium]